MFPLKKIEKYFPPIEIKKLKPKQNEKSLPSNYYAFDHLSLSLTSSLNGQVAIFFNLELQLATKFHNLILNRPLKLAIERFPIRVAQVFVKITERALKRAGNK